jgi:hypothetical protein
MLAVTGGAMRRPHFRTLGHKHAMLAAPILAQQGCRRTGRIRHGMIVAGPAKGGNLVRSSDAVRVSPTLRLAVADTFAVASIARKACLAVRMAEHIRGNLAVARFA